MGISEALEPFREGQNVPEGSVSERISEISMYNPTRNQVHQLLGRFREAGVDTPVIYPYVAGDEAYKLQVAVRLLDWVKQH